MHIDIDKTDHRSKALRVLFFVLVGVCLIGLAANFGGSDKEIIKVGFLGSQDDEDYVGALAFKQVVEKRTNGAVEVKIFPAGQFCSNARECLEALQSGTLEVTMTTIGGTGSLFGAAQVLDLPYAFKNDAMAECVLDGPMLAKLRTAMLDADTNVRLATISNTGGWRDIATVSKPVREVADLQGLKLRTVTAPIQQQLVAELGGSATPIAWSELYSALATRVVEGTKNSVQDIVGMKFHEHIKHLTRDGHAYMAALWWYSEPLWQKQSPEMRDILSEAFAALQKAARDSAKQGEAQAIADFKASGGSVYNLSEAQKLSFEEAAKPIRAWFEDRYGRPWLDILDASVKACHS